MPINTGTLNLLTQRRIEAQIVKPIYEEFSKQLGIEITRELLQRVISQLAEEHGKQLSEDMGNNSLSDFAESLKTFSKGGANEMEVLELTDEKFSFNMTKCLYADMYKELGIPELGVILSCARDFSFCKGFNPEIILNRTQTIMEGAEYCDFRYNLNTLSK